MRVAPACTCNPAAPATRHEGRSATSMLVIASAYARGASIAGVAIATPVAEVDALRCCAFGNASMYRVRDLPMVPSLQHSGTLVHPSGWCIAAQPPVAIGLSKTVPHAEGRLRRPGLGQHSSRHRPRRRHCRTRLGEHGEEAIPLPALSHTLSAVLRDDRVKRRVVAGGGGAHGRLVALPERRAPLHVGEQEGHGAGR
jgi:hypothetical protein